MVSHGENQVVIRVTKLDGALTLALLLAVAAALAAVLKETGLFFFHPKLHGIHVDYPVQ